MGASPRDVVVVGASLGGLFAAAALARPGTRVTVVERDELPEHPAPRAGVPQGRQPHVLLHRGLVAMEQLLPGVRDDLLRAGAVALDTGDLAWLNEPGWATPVREYGVVSATRPLVEHVVRQRVLALRGVRLVQGTRVQGLARGVGGRAWSVDTTRREGHAVVRRERLEADLVVDASGRASRLPLWLSELGVEPARRHKVDARVGYATQVLELPHDRVAAAGVVVLQRAGARGGLALPVEGDRWLVAGVGAGELRPSRADLRTFLGLVPDPALAQLVDAGHLVGDVAVHRQTGNLRHDYHRVHDWPDGLLVLGDALCCFNPVYGQGIAVAALEAVELRDADASGRLGRPGGARRLLGRFASVVDVPWGIATGTDLRLPTTEGRLTGLDAAFSSWTQELTRLAAHGDRTVQRSLSAVYHLAAPPTTLLRPRLLAHALRARVTGVGPGVPRPQILAPAQARRDSAATS
ncbi:NAD(P)/FAD-dependent oxidoreductase [Cellulomonas massiliensis]|uniref:NAD(P)/FAD-dependent oxidoreductase n=1 Tax=Cellulomonas massiliensis TaxID=1465811 RepID=UPI000319797E|nr:FAD-dependent monooxygenase [Cellulomonas massiliensis]